MSSASTTLADQWAEYFYCDALGNEELLKKAEKTVTSGSNTKGNENIITNGSGFAINEGQGLIIVEDGKIVEFSMEAGRFTWQDGEPSLFTGGFKGLKESFATFGKRFVAGGTAAKDQRVYFINLKEIFDNKFGSATPMAYKDPTYRGIYIRYFGQYTFKITDPIIFYSNISGNVTSIYTKTELMQQAQAEFVNALDVSIARCADEGYQYNDLVKKQLEIATFMNDALDDAWKSRRGMEIESVAIEKVTPDAESRDRIEKIDDAIMMSDQRVATGRLTSAQATAMESAGANEGGAMNAFVGMGMAQQAGGMQNSNMFVGNENQNSPFFKQEESSKQPPTNMSWMCSCGHENNGKFCSECGSEKPNSEKWKCAKCGNENSGKFCSECGTGKL